MNPRKYQKESRIPPLLKKVVFYGKVKYVCNSLWEVDYAI